MNKKLEKLYARSKELADELKTKEEAKAKIDSEIEKLQMQELKAFLITNDITLNDDFYDMAKLVKQIIDSGVNTDEVKGIIDISGKAAGKNESDNTGASENKLTEETESNEE